MAATETNATKSNVWMWFGESFVVSAILSGLVAASGNSGVKFKDSASVLAFITVLAVAIERGIEMVWTLLNDKQGFGGWWPLSIVAERAAGTEPDALKIVRRKTAIMIRTTD